MHIIVELLYQFYENMLCHWGQFKKSISHSGGNAMEEFDFQVSTSKNHCSKKVCQERQDETLLVDL